MASSRMVPFALVTMMRVLRFDGYSDVTVIGCDERVSLPSKVTNERWAKQKGFERMCSGLSC